MSHRPAGRRVALLAIASPCPLSRLPAGRRLALPCPRAALLAAAPPCPACASPCPARMPPCWPLPCCPHCPSARRPAAWAALLLPALLRAALLAGALLPACRPAGSRIALPSPRAALLAAALPCPCRTPLFPSCVPPLPALRASLVLVRRPTYFDTWLDDLQLYLLSDSRDSVSLFDHTSGASLAPPATADSATCSQWLTRDAAARLAVRNHLLLAECTHFGQHKTAKALYNVVVARYSSPATGALCFSLEST
ncbi:unnamed protein product [Closterium sp. NIES-53]